MKKKHLILAIFLLLFVFGPGLSYFLTDWFWFQSLGFETLFSTVLKAKLFYGFLGFLISFALIFLNLKTALSFTKEKPLFVHSQMQEREIDISKTLEKGLIPFSLLFSFLSGITISSKWETILRFLNSTPFNEFDPIFNRDISFYFFSLPFIQLVLQTFLFLLFFSTLFSFLIYLGKKAFVFFGKDRIYYTSQGQKEFLKAERKPRNHILVLFALILLILSLHTYLVRIPGLLYSSSGPFVGAGYTDIHARMPVLNIMSLLLVIGSFLMILNIFKKNYKVLFNLLVAYILLSVLGGWLYPLVMQKFIVDPNEFVKESPYILNNISATQKAFNLDEVEERNLSGESSLTIEDIEKNQTTVNNIRIWDRDPLLDTFGQVQEIRTYYDFTSIDNDRYTINGEYRQVLLSPRELNSNNLPNPSFINKHLTFTHGFGLTLGPVNEKTEEGLPVLFIKNLPPVSESESLNVSRPEIYFGELTDDYVFVKTKTQEFDYPSGEENVFTSYKGEGGVTIDTFWKKLFYAVRFGELKVLFSDEITKESRVMHYRNIRDRVERLTSFLEFDKDPYMVVLEDGSLKWIFDAYTKSHLYPYSHTIGKTLENKGVNYIRNSVKIVIDAYTGKMKLYIAEPDDPLIKTYSKIFKGVFIPLSEMPENLKSHIRYPEDIFLYQTYLYSTYHMEEAKIFYNKEDQWQIPRISEGGTDPMVRHIIMKLPGEEKEEFILMVPFTPKGKDNLSAWMTARSDGENYGELVVYRFPKQRLVFGPSQIINRINQDPEISRQISLWDQRGSQVNLGSLLVIPIEESLLYVRPLYIRSEGGKIPELKRVIVAYENKIAMAENLEDSIAQVFQSGGQTEETPPSQRTPLKKAQRLYEEAIEAQKQGNWSLYGEKIKELGEVLEKL
jgi:hypothetical protein